MVGSCRSSGPSTEIKDLHAQVRHDVLVDELERLDASVQELLEGRRACAGLCVGPEHMRQPVVLVAANITRRHNCAPQIKPHTCHPRHDAIRDTMATTTLVIMRLHRMCKAECVGAWLLPRKLSPLYLIQ